MPRGQGVKKLGDLFQKYQQNLKPPQQHVVDTFCEVVENVLAIRLNPKQATYQPFKRILVLTAPGAIQTEIKLHKQELLTHLKGRLGDKHCPTEIL